MLYPEHILEQIRSQSDIVDIISDYTKLTKKGHSYVGLCPFHNEKTPSFSVSQDKNMYYCFGCGAGGNVITFLMEKENMTFVEVVKELAERAHIELETIEQDASHIERTNKKNTLYEVHKEAAKFFYYTLQQEYASGMLDYLTERGLSKETIKRFGLGYSMAQYNALYQYLQSKGYDNEILLESGLVLKSTKSGVLYDRFSDRIIFPIFSTDKKVIAFGGRIVGNGQPKYLNSPESMLFEKSRTLYGLHLAKTTRASHYILVEGYMDVIAMHQAGFDNTVASLGTAFTIGHAKLLKRYTSQVVILYDSDNAGVQAAIRAIPILRQQNINIKVLQLPDGKDPDEFLKKHQKHELEELIESAPSDIWFRILQLEQQYDLAKIDQKVIFLENVAQLIGELPSTIEQDVYKKELADFYRIEYSALEGEIKKYYQKKMNVSIQSDTNKSKHIQYKQQTNIEQVLLSTIYHYPYVFEHVKEYIYPELFDEGLMQELAKAILGAIEEDKPIDVNYFNNTYTEAKDQAVISGVFMHEDIRYQETEKLERMLTETIKRLNMSYIERQIKTTKDIQKVQQLLSRKKVLDKLYIAFING